MHRKYQVETNGLPLGDDEVQQISPNMRDSRPNPDIPGNSSRQLYPNGNFGGGQPQSNSNLYDIQRVPSPSGGLRSIQRGVSNQNGQNYMNQY